MSEKMLGQILDTLQTMNTHLVQMDTRLKKVEDRIDTIEVDLKSIKNDTKEIPFIKQAVHETYEVTKQISSSQASFERQASKDLNMHSHSIDILNRRQLKLEAEIEHIKQK